MNAVEIERIENKSSLTDNLTHSGGLRLNKNLQINVVNRVYV